MQRHNLVCELESGTNVVIQYPGNLGNTPQSPAVCFNRFQFHLISFSSLAHLPEFSVWTNNLGFARNEEKIISGAEFPILVILKCQFEIMETLHVEKTYHHFLRLQIIPLTKHIPPPQCNYF